jgi:hemoglobin
MKFLILIFAVGLAVSVTGQEKARATLYERVGRYDGIASIVDAYLKGVRADPQFARFSGGRATESLVRAKQMFKDQLCALTGGPCVYIGRDMKTAHGGLGITESDWAASMKYMGAALDQAKVTGTDRKEFLELIDSMKGMFVESKGKS